MRATKLALAILIGLSTSSLVSAETSVEKAVNKEAAMDIALAHQHFRALNETDPQKRKALFEEVYTPDVHFVSPRVAIDGRAVLEKLFDDIHKKTPGVLFQEIGEIEAHHDIARVHWAIIISGVSSAQTGDDFLKIKDGKVSEVYIIVNGWTKSGIANDQK
jgi:predicted SnoaL-like aldol condensation-catalyzing enzyme